jgi:hypothetical protein
MNNLGYFFNKTTFSLGVISRYKNSVHDLKGRLSFFDIKLKISLNQSLIT